jgi:hypothetical protein
MGVGFGLCGGDRSGVSLGGEG